MDYIKIWKSKEFVEGDEVTGGWRKLHNEELQNLHCSQDRPRPIISVIRSRKVRWAGHVACMRVMRNACKVLVRKPEGTRSLGRPRRKLGIVLKRISEKSDGRVWTRFNWLKTGTDGRLL
jgi:hypothetical protein